MRPLGATLDYVPGVAFARSSQHEFLRNIQELIDALSLRIRKDRTAVEEYLLLGRLFRIRGEARRAYRIHRNLLARPMLDRETERRLHVDLGFDLLEARLHDFGEGYFLKSLESKRQDVAALDGLSRAYEFQQKWEEAERFIVKLIKLGRPEQTRLAFVCATLAQDYLKRGLVTRARRAVHRAFRAEEHNIFAHLTLADVFIAAERYERAIEGLKAAVRRWPAQSFLVLRRLEDAHYRMGIFSKYEQTLRECIRSYPDNYYLHYSLARHLQKKRKNAEALEVLRRAYDLNPVYVNTIRDRVRLLDEKSGRRDISSFTDDFFAAFKRSRRFICPNCRQRHIPVTWRCTKCGTWGTFEVRYEFPGP
ncbi:MAG TPA: hypothetical protein VI895_09105 [Bdellovibrionota bacterium]|nr:hypothetical protein [Bdellovibrionota bacterium]